MDISTLTYAFFIWNARFKSKISIIVILVLLFDDHIHPYKISLEFFRKPQNQIGW